MIDITNEKIDKKIIMKSYFLFIIFTLLLILFFYFKEYNKQIDKYRNTFQQIAVEHNTLIEREFINIKSDIDYVSSNNIIEILKIKNDTKLKKELENDIFRFVNSKNKYDQIRILNKDGQEIVRVDKKGDTSIVISKDKLQNKKDRYYFKDALKLRPNDIYMSHLDLNKEFGKIEQPIKPMIRFVKPIFDNKLNFYGIIIFNYKAKNLINKLNLRLTNQNIDLIWINKKGEVLLHPTYEYNWSFMYKKDVTMEKIEPFLWEKTKEWHSGYFNSEKYLYYFEEYYPYKFLIKTSDNILSDIDKKWYIILQKKHTHIHNYVVDKLISLAPLIVLFIIFGIIFIWQLLTSRHILNKEKEQKAISLRAFDKTAQAIVITDKNNEIILVNKAFCSITGYSFEKVKGKNPNYMKSGKTSKKEYKALWNTLNEKGYWNGILWNRTSKGEIYPSDFKINVYKNELGEIKNYIAVFSNITQQIEEKKLLEEKNIQIEKSKQKVEEAMSELKSAQSQVIQSEKMAALGQLIAGIAHEINTPLGAINSSATNISNALDYLILNTINLTVKLPTNLRELFINILTNELEPTNMIEIQNQRAIKKEVMSKLKEYNIDNARRYADIIVSSNLIEKIDMLLPLLKSEYSKEIMDAINKINSTILNTQNISHAVSRASRIVKALKNFSHQDIEDKMVYASLKNGIDTVLVIYHNQIKREITIKKEYAEVSDILCHFDELNQVWTNLIQNAIHAMEYNGELTIKIYEDDKYQVVQISDTGLGMSDEIKNKIFEPFFTTKPVGEGTGLGLDIVNKIVKKHNGFINVESQLGIGTTFKVYIDKNLKENNNE